MCSQTIPCSLEERVLGLFQEKEGSGVGGLCCEAAADLTCARACRKALCHPLGTGASLSSCCSGQLLLKWPGEHTRAGFPLVPLFLRADCRDTPRTAFGLLL